MLIEIIEKQLEKDNISFNEFRELIIRLLNYSIVCRDESQIEQQLYDRFLRISKLVTEYLKIMDVRVFHDVRFEYIRLYPPSSHVPGMDEAEVSAFSGSLRARLSQAEVALILILRLQYDKALREAQVDDKGYVTESFEAINIAMKNIIGRNLPDKPTERRQLFSRCKKLRLIDYRHEDDVLKAEAWLKIHPMIVSFVNNDAILALENKNTTSVSINDDASEQIQTELITEAMEE
ncbi:hypothetical protein MNBD_GAMMA22-1883 [hydrothermal vent metagenome]|uniref:DUF4194 domain-containing protein n=1 Tax=hydrothermal vent metagenome TaxID=652676 RepID=A0A3B0ZVT5_9ZZZZ